MRYFSSTVTRFDSVGWAVITGLMRKPDNSVWISSGAMPSLAASASTWAKVPRNAARPRVRSIWRRRRMAAFCSAMASSWNQNALRLKGAGHQLRGEAGDIGAAEQGGLDLGLVPAHHFEQELEQEVGRLLGRDAADHGRGRLGVETGRFQLLIHGDARHSRPRRSAGQGLGRAHGRRSTSLP